MSAKACRSLSESYVCHIAYPNRVLVLFAPPYLQIQSTIIVLLVGDSMG